ncbi:MAG: orotate phosphoribosyltransferase [Chlamydiae bacterium]|nr:orotate phosphoribosyltransferase [Chlamydiota bacterium]
MLHFDILQKLFDIGCIKFGSFRLKSGDNCPFDIDLRLVLSYPSLLEDLAQALWQKIAPIPKDHLCGIPYTAFSIATYLSTKHHIPMLLKRIDLKEHSSKQPIEGFYKPQEKCLILEDVITSGHSILETIQNLQDLELITSAVAVLIDREQGGAMAIEKQGFHLHAVMTISQICAQLKALGKITPTDLEKTKRFVEHHQVEI